MHFPLLQNEALNGGRNPSPLLVAPAGRLISAPHVCCQQSSDPPPRRHRGAAVIKGSSFYSLVAMYPAFNCGATGRQLCKQLYPAGGEEEEGRKRREGDGIHRPPGWTESDLGEEQEGARANGSFWLEIQ